MAYIYDLADVWADGATTFTGIKLSVTDTASAAASNLMDLQVGGVSQFRVSKAGTAVFAGGISVTGSVTHSSNIFTLQHTGAAQNRGLVLQSTAGVNWTDLFLLRDAANTLAQRNGVNAQAFNLYNTYTDASNYERGFMRWSSNVLEIGAEAAGTGTARAARVLGSNFYVGAGENISISGVGGVTLNNARNYAFSGTFAGQLLWDSIGIGRSATGVAYVSNGSTGGGALEFREQTAPAAPATDNVRIYAEDDGAGKTRLMALFATGAAVQLAVEP
jgi:hypothetical protein